MDARPHSDGQFQSFLNVWLSHMPKEDPSTLPAKTEQAERYQSPETEQYPRFGRLLIILALVTVSMFLATWASVYFLDS